jgi:D-alanyl-D-alanine carboxypeptidase
VWRMRWLKIRPTKDMVMGRNDSDPGIRRRNAVRGGRLRTRILAATVLLVLFFATTYGYQPASTLNSSSPPAGPASSQISTQLDGETVRRLDVAINQAMRTASIPGAIVGVWAPQGQYVRAAGIADKATGAPMHTNFYSRIGSVTKTFTVTAVLQLVDEGKLGLDDPIAKYIDGVPSGDQITLRQLADMRSGLCSYSATDTFRQALFADPHRIFSPRELLGYAFARSAIFPPGQGFDYSNTNAILLGLVVEKVSGQSLPRYIRGHILDALGMSHTSFPTTASFPQPHAQGYTRHTANAAETAATDWNPSWAWSAGAMISTLDDLRVWARAVVSGTLLSPALQQQRLPTADQTSAPMQFGYGLGLLNIAGWIGHNGTVPGYQTIAVYLPEKQLTLVILTNTDVSYQGADPSTMLATAITEIVSPQHVFGVNPQPQQSDPPPPSLNKPGCGSQTMALSSGSSTLSS